MLVVKFKVANKEKVTCGFDNHIEASCWAIRAAICYGLQGHLATYEVYEWMPRLV